MSRTTVSYVDSVLNKFPSYFYEQIIDERACNNKEYEQIFCKPFNHFYFFFYVSRLSLMFAFFSDVRDSLIDGLTSKTN